MRVADIRDSESSSPRARARAQNRRGSGHLGDEPVQLEPLDVVDTRGDPFSATGCSGRPRSCDLRARDRSGLGSRP
jgi:hypothetical protein